VKPVVHGLASRLSFSLVGVVAQPGLHVRRHVSLAGRKVAGGCLVIAVIRIASNAGGRGLVLGAMRFEGFDPRLALFENTFALVEARLF
jgi:hypothetical protein